MANFCFTNVQDDCKKWLARMVKLLGMFGFMCIQPEQTPFNFSDAWSWLSRVVNTCSK